MRVGGLVGSVQQRNFDECIENEEVDCRIAIVGGIVMLVGTDRIQPLRAFVEVGDDAGFVKLGEGRQDRVGITKVRASHDFQAPLPDQCCACTRQGLDLGQALGAVAAGQQNQRDDCRGRYRRYCIHAYRHLERKGRHQRLLSFCIGVRAEFGRVNQVSNRQGFAEAQVNLASRSASPQEPKEPGDGFGLLLLSTLFDRIIFDFGDLVVSDTDRDKGHIVETRPLDRLDDVAEQTESWRQQLAGAGARALQRPKQREPFLDQVIDVPAKRRLVDLVILERAAQENDAAAAPDSAEARGIQVDATEREWQRQVCFVQHHGQGHRIEHRLVADQEHDRASAQHLCNPLEL